MTSKTLPRWIFVLAVFLLGLVVGYVLRKPPRSAPDQQWKQLFNEEADHRRIMAFEEALAKQGAPKDAAELSKQLDAQLRIEDLIVKSRDAEYAKWTPFNALFAGGFSLLGGIVGALITAFVTNKRRATKPTEQQPRVT